MVSVGKTIPWGTKAEAGTTRLLSMRTHSQRSGCRTRCAMIIAGVLASLLGGACTTQISREKMDYQFRQAMIDPQWTPESRVTSRPRQRATIAHAKKSPSAARCRRLVGQRFPGPHAEALARMLGRCLRAPIAAATLRNHPTGLHRSPPSPGELILFHNTRDANQNRRLDDRFSDAGVVVGLKHQRVSFIFLRQERVHLGVLSLKQPHRRRISHAIENTYLRVIRPDDPPRTQYLAGQLLAGFWPGP